MWWLKKPPTTFSFFGVFPMIRGIRVCVGIDLAFSYNQAIFPMNFQCQSHCSLLSLHSQQDLVLSPVATWARWELSMGHLRHSKNEQADPLWLALQTAVKSLETGHYTATSPAWEVAVFAKVAVGNSLCTQRREESERGWTVTSPG